MKTQAIKETSEAGVVCQLANFKGLAMPATPFLRPGPLSSARVPFSMASSRQTMGICLIETLWRALGFEIDPLT